MKRIAATAAAALIVALIVGPTPAAEAHTLTPTGPQHTHTPCTWNDCYRWILANGAIIQGPSVLLYQQYGYVLVLCSRSLATSSGGFAGWAVYQATFGPFGNNGQHVYCKEPKLGIVRWSLLP